MRSSPLALLVAAVAAATAAGYALVQALAPEAYMVRAALRSCAR